MQIQLTPQKLKQVQNFQTEVLLIQQDLLLSTPTFY